jgi:carbon storage regulator
MLVLSRRKEERIFIGHDIIIKIVEVRGGKVFIGIEAPDNTSIHREEVYDRIHPKPTSQP